MSGLPYKTKKDMEDARAKYLAYLNLVINNDDRNLQANKVYKRTGQPSEMTDTRLFSEKLADIQRLKTEMRSKLLEITDGQEAGIITNSLDENQLIFLAQHFQIIKADMKKLYSLGVLAPIFIHYLTKYIQNYNDNKGVETGLQETNKLLSNQNQILKQIASKQEIDEIKKHINDLGYENTMLGLGIINRLSNLELTLNNVNKIASDIDNIENSNEKNEILKLLNNIVDELPTKSDLQHTINNMNILSEKNDQNASINELMKLDEKIAIGSDVQEETSAINNLVNAGVAIPVNAGIATPLTAYTKDQQIMMNILMNDSDVLPLTRDSKRQYINDLYEIYSKNEQDLKDTSRNMWILQNFPELSPPSGKSLNFQNLNDGQIKPIIELLNKKVREKIQPTQGKGMKGRGIATRTRSYQILDGDVDYNNGIRESAKFIPIGRYLINKRQLDKDIIAIKRTGGSIIKDLPSTRVTKKLGSIVKKILGGGLPSYDDIDNLDEKEKDFLYKVAKHTRIDDKLSIPVPKKDQDDKDINEFEIMKGQILSGNDNPEVVKKFKTIILKLSNKNMIPKGQVRELLLELTTLGH